jgi:hypothetical protein
LSYGTYPAILDGMLQNIRSTPRFGRTSADHRVTDEAARLNPWLRWRSERPARRHVLSVAELAECTCPELCDRDHANE